ncbi:fibronectin type III domain-containing protein [bacterium]|nr:fibronectin type III domain-containing protein [bacterium]
MRDIWLRNSSSDYRVCGHHAGICVAGHFLVPERLTATEWENVVCTGLDADSTYTFRVKARNGLGVQTLFSQAGTGITNPEGSGPSATEGPWQIYE